MCRAACRTRFRSPGPWPSRARWSRIMMIPLPSPKVNACQHGDNEYDSLRKVLGSFRKIAVVNSPFKAYVNEDGILVVSLEEFLLDRDSLNL